MKIRFCPLPVIYTVQEILRCRSLSQTTGNRAVQLEAHSDVSNDSCLSHLTLIRNSAAVNTTGSSDPLCHPAGLTPELTEGVRVTS